MAEGGKAAPLTTPDLLERFVLLLGRERGSEALFSVLLDDIVARASAGPVYLLLGEPGAGRLETRAARDAHGDLMPIDFSETKSPAVHRALEEGVAYLEPATAESPAALAVPLRAAGQTVGVIYADRVSAHLAAADRAAIQALANLAAVLVEREQFADQLQAAEATRREFVSLTTHQLRVPLTSISGYTDLLLSGMAGSLSERQEQFLQTIRRNVDRMGTLIGDLSDLNRLQDGRMPLQPDAFNLASLIQRILQQHDDAIASQAHDVQVHLPGDLPLAYGDAQTIQRVFEKILTNAIYYTPRGGLLTIGAVRHGQSLQVTVADNGIGISAEDRSRLFTPFFRGEEEIVREHVGWGLSLALAKALVEAQDGRLWCESQAGQGSAFHFSLPVAPGETQ